MQKFTVTIHMNGRTYDAAGVGTDVRDQDEYTGRTASQALLLAEDWMTGPDKDNVTIAIVAE